jgi:hypothetical protein
LSIIGRRSSNQDFIKKVKIKFFLRFSRSYVSPKSIKPKAHPFFKKEDFSWLSKLKFHLPRNSHPFVGYIMY